MAACVANQEIHHKEILFEDEFLALLPAIASPMMHATCCEKSVARRAGWGRVMDDTQGSAAGAAAPWATDVPSAQADSRGPSIGLYSNVAACHRETG